MNKKAIIVSTILLLAILIGGGSIYYFKDKIFKNQTQTTNTGTGKVVDELIKNNYVAKVHHLDLRDKSLTQIPDICSMVIGTNYEYDIWSIDLANNGFSEINTDLSCLKNLQELNLSFNKITKIQNLENLTFIKKIDLGNNELTKIEGLNKLTTLEDLHLGYNKITKAEGLEDLKNLKSLKLQHNDIDDISGLQKLYNLEELKMEFNNLDEEDLKNIKDLKKLKIITVGENKGIKKETIDKLNKFTLQNIDTKELEEAKKE